MTILFVDGFENYNSIDDLAGYWAQNGAAPSVFQQAGRDASGVSIRLLAAADTLEHGIVASVSGSVGFAHRFGTLPTLTEYFVDLRRVDASQGSHIRLRVTTAGFLQVTQGNITILETSTRTLSPGIWYYIEMKWLIDNASGKVEVFVNGTKGGWIDFTGDTLNAGTAFVDGIQFKGAGTLGARPHDFDDFYVLDLLGSAPGNNRLGDSIVETLNPSGAGAEAQWAPSAGANFENVDEATPDGDTTFNSSGNTNDDDRFAMDNLVNIPSTVFAVQANGAFRLENAGLRTCRLKVHDTVTEGQGADFNPTFDATYVGEFEVFEDHPTGAAPWSTAEVNGMEAGYRIQS